VDVPNDLTTALSNFLGTLMGGRASLPVGSGTATAQVSGVLSVNTTQAGTGADTNETDLWTYSLPANTLNVDGKAVRVVVGGSMAANANTKTARFYFGGSSQVINDQTTAPNGGEWRGEFVIIRTGAAAQVWGVVKTMGATPQSSLGFSQRSTGDTTTALTIKVTGQNGTAAANDIVFRGAVVEVLN
jgi:hypothetical protein